MGTTHNEAKSGEIANIVLMPGDPLRAKYVADVFLENPIQFNGVRNMLGYTGTYKGKKVSVMGSGMGMPSIGIYSYELFRFYGVEAIIRIGSAGSYHEDLNVYDLVLAESAWSESTYANVQNGCEDQVLYSNNDLNSAVEAAAKELGYPLRKGPVHSSDVFYNEPEMMEKKGDNIKKSCLCVEMESFALFHNANVTGKKAACLLTISNNLITQKEISPREREQSFNRMINTALEAGIRASC